MTNSIVVYPRGFLGFDIGLPPVDKSANLNKIIEAVRLNKQISTRQRIVISNHDVENIWKQYKFGNRFIASMAFRESILQTALRAFGTDSFYEWCELQDRNGFMSEMHKHFLNDTFTFLKTGKRNICLQHWMRMVHIKDITAEDESTEYQYKEYFGLSSPIQLRRETDLNNTIINWTSQKNGFEDLAGTLHILFGDDEIH